MTPDEALWELSDKFGVLDGYHDLSGRRHSTSKDTQKALLRAQGLELDNDAMVFEALAHENAAQEERIYPAQVIVKSNMSLKLGFGAGANWRLIFDGKLDKEIEDRAVDQICLPPLVSGLYILEVESHGRVQRINLIAAPDRLPMIPDITGKASVWGINIALYGLRSERNTGLGDFADLAELSATLAGQGSDFIGLNPVHALGWNNGGTISPYSPSHRGFLNTAHIAVDCIPSLKNSKQAQEILQAAGPDSMPFRQSILADYAQHKDLQQVVLENLYKVYIADADHAVSNKFLEYRATEGRALAQFSLYETISEVYGSDWRKWPTDLCNRRPSSIASLEVEFADRIQFHSWLQWVADQQLAAAQSTAVQSGMALGLYMDLAVGPRRCAAESWCECDTVAKNVSLGAPPDDLSPAGQNWDITAFAPRKIVGDGFGAWRQALSVVFKHAGVIRIDHVLGLNRSFWIPDDGSPGGYVRQPFDALLALLAIEAERNNTIIIGEDLGLVPEGFRETIQDRGFYGYSVLQYEKNEWGQFKGYRNLRPQSLACFGTHDTPTLAGYQSARDISWWQKLGWINEQSAADRQRQRSAELEEFASVNCEPSNDKNVSYDYQTLSDCVHGSLAISTATMVSIQLDDILAVTEAQNLPGTIDEHPNWRRRCPLDIKDISKNHNLQKIAKHMQLAGRGNSISVPQGENE